MMTRRPRFAVVAVVAALVLGGCTGGEVDAPSGSPDPSAGPGTVDEPLSSPIGGTLRIGLSSDPLSLDPRFLADETGELIVDALFDPLVRIDTDGEIVPAAATSWEVGELGREFRFALRRASFHDGSPVTAHDFARAFNRIADGTAEPVSFLAYLLEGIEGAEESAASGVPLEGLEVIDDHTLVIRLTEPDFGFVTSLADPSLVPVPAHADEDPDAFAAQPIGNGPFAMAGPREVGAFIRMTRFEDHRSPALLDEIVFTIYGDVSGLDRQWVDIREGQLHVADLAPHHRVEARAMFGTSVDGYRGPGVVEGIGSSVYLYGFDTTTPPFDDPRLRRAVSLSIDREALAEVVLQETRAPATGILPPFLAGALPGRCDACVYDPEAAAELFDEVLTDASPTPAEVDADVHSDSDSDSDSDADVVADANVDAAADADAAGADVDAEPSAAPAEGPDADPDDPGDAQSTEADPPAIERLTLTHPRGDTHAAIAERMAADISAALDIEVDFQARGLQSLLQAVADGEVPVFRLGWEANVPDPAAYLRPLFHASEVGSENLMQYENEDVDALLDEARETPGERSRAATYREAEALILDDMPVLPLLWYRHSAVVTTEVRNLVISPLGRMNLREVWIDPDSA